MNKNKRIQDSNDPRDDRFGSGLRKLVRILLSLYRSIEFPDRDAGSCTRYRLRLLQTERRMNVHRRAVSDLRIRVSQILQGRGSEQDGIFQRDALWTHHYGSFVHRVQENEIRQRIITLLHILYTNAKTRKHPSTGR